MRMFRGTRPFVVGCLGGAGPRGAIEGTDDARAHAIGQWESALHGVWMALEDG